MIMDILLSTARAGGVENIIKKMLTFMESENFHIRVVQLVWEGERWLPENAAFYPLAYGKGDYNIEEFVSLYSAFLEKNGIPDIILATVWPYNCYVARCAIEKKGGNVKIISYMHHNIEKYESVVPESFKWLSYADAHFAINSDIHRNLYEYSKDWPIYRIKNPVDITDEYRKEDSRELSYRLAFVGRLEYQKNPEMLLDVLKNNTKWHISVIGSAEDDYEEELRKKAIKMGVNERISWCGWQTDPWKYTDDVDALILTSISEAFPLAAIEALSRGIPVIASRVSGIKELIQDGKNGYTYDIGDIDQLDSIIKKIEKENSIGISPSECRKSAMPYETEYVLTDMMYKICSVALDRALLPNSVEMPYFVGRPEGGV
ncbi:MAG: glycosyltransferase [Lachnospiraceae bacterium]|nr:glycosyltransferase [Lachnospiraceae bacterium]